MQPEKFIQDYGLALASQNWENVAPLIHHNACVTFSDGSVYIGIQSIGDAYKRNFALIKNEQYSINDIHWVNTNHEQAVYIFKFNWIGLINGQELGGSGTGTAVIILEDGRWKLMAEHLGPARA